MSEEENPFSGGFQSDSPPPGSPPPRSTKGPSRRPVALRDREVPLIEIVDAQKTQEGASSPYITYVIHSPGHETRRRYSEFESLRIVLGRMHPVLIIPPIPSKQSIGEYAIKQGKAKEDVNVIARRKRMLQVFLNRIARHPILGEDKAFTRFLQGGVSWAEITHQPPVALLPKNVLRAPATDPTDQSAQALFSVLPVPSSSQPLQEPDQRFIDSEVFTAKFSSHLQGNVEKVNRRAVKRWSEYGADMAEMGAVLNGFALLEGGDGGGLPEAIERVGQAVDSTYMNTTAMLQEWEQVYTEPLQEYTQFSSIIKQLLKYRHLKHLQFEMARDVLDSKRVVLEELERSEAEARRLDKALSRVREIEDDGRVGARITDTPTGDQAGQSNPPSKGDASPSTEGSPSITTATMSEPWRPDLVPPPARRGGSFGFLGALGHSLQGIMDVDPESTRRNNIGKTRDSITHLEQALQAATQDLGYASQTIQADLDRFQRQKVADLRKMCLAFAEMHREWCKKNLEQWQEAKQSISQIQLDATPSVP